MSFLNNLHVLAQSISPDQLNIPKTQNLDNLSVGLNIAFGIAGAVCLLIIVLAGFRYVTSQGDPGATAKAKNGIIYALIGLVVIIFGATIVNFVIGRTA